MTQPNTPLLYLSVSASRDKEARKSATKLAPPRRLTATLLALARDHCPQWRHGHWLCAALLASLLGLGLRDVKLFWFRPNQSGLNPKPVRIRF